MGDVQRAPDPNGMQGMNQGYQGMAQGPMGAMVGRSVGAQDGMQRAAQGGMQPNAVSDILAMLIPALGSIFTLKPQGPAAGGKPPQQPM
jgi:hypothetical protein